MSSRVDPQSFASSLRELVDARRSFGGHPLWRRIAAGGVDADGMRRFAVQFFLQVREFPRAVSALHAALIHWFEVSTRQRPFLEGAAAITLAAEGQVPDAFGPFARALEKHYELTREQVEFWDLHEVADREHSDVGDHFVIGFADTRELQARIREAVRTSLEQWWQFFDGIERDIDAPCAL